MSSSNPLTELLDLAWRKGFTVQSQFFRDNAITVALAASMGLITTLLPNSSYGSTWRITPKGLIELYKLIESEKESRNESE